MVGLALHRICSSANKSLVFGSFVVQHMLFGSLYNPGFGRHLNSVQAKIVKIAQIVHKSLGWVEPTHRPNFQLTTQTLAHTALSAGQLRIAGKRTAHELLMTTCATVPDRCTAQSFHMPQLI